MGKRLRLQGQPTPELEKLKEEHRQLLNRGVDLGTSEVDAIFAGISHLGVIAQKVHEINQEIRRINRRTRAKNLYAVRKQYGLIKTAAQKRAEKEAKRNAEREEERRREEWVPDCCYCHMGHPPCGYCTREIDEEEEEP